MRNATIPVGTSTMAASAAHHNCQRGTWNRVGQSMRNIGLPESGGNRDEEYQPASIEEASQDGRDADGGIRCVNL
jgi:hypothetical protein